ncbi:(+)-piperitol/(+)-sesamin synthase CYP81Q2-like [Aristolochia californica]|uniref:(+)-piperitol/(+)-sesamin synthase CYP81Q2-like n=1 Tax=Aristolochia californica TaxID=171875 RepID=UPI0035D8672C
MWWGSRGNPPGPLGLPFIGHLHLITSSFARDLAKLADRYGPVIFLRFGSRPVVVVSSPSAIEECFSKNDIVLANRPQLLVGKCLGDNFANLGWAPYGNHWRNVRRFANTELFATSRLNCYAAVREPEINSFIKHLFRRSTGGHREVKLRKEFMNLISNCLLAMLLGKRYYGEDVEGWEEAKQFRENTEELVHFIITPALGDFLPIFRWIDSQWVEKKMMVLAKKRDAFMQRQIDERRKILENGGVGTKCMLDALLSNQSADPDFYTDKNIKGIIDALLAAGVDTLYYTLEWALALLIRNPDVMKKARDELDFYVGHDRMIQEADLPKLEILNGIINETLRMYPPAPLAIPHEAAEDCTVGGFKVRRGAMIMVNILAIQTDPKLWEDPCSFKPERFKAVEEAKGGLKWIVFGDGRRSCPGAGMALRELAMILGALIHCFEWATAGEEELDMNVNAGFFMPRENPLVAVCEPRKSMIDVLSNL